MLAALKGYYDGNQIIVDDRDRKNLYDGDQLIITVINRTGIPRKESLGEKRRRLLAGKKYIKKTNRAALEIDDYIRGLRSDDRL